MIEEIKKWLDELKEEKLKDNTSVVYISINSNIEKLEKILEEYGKS